MATKKASVAAKTAQKAAVAPASAKKAPVATPKKAAPTVKTAAGRAAKAPATPKAAPKATKPAKAPVSSAPDVDPLLPEVSAWYLAAGKASISGIQRQFRLGYNRAAALYEALLADPPQKTSRGSKPTSMHRLGAAAKVIGATPQTEGAVESMTGLEPGAIDTSLTDEQMDLGLTTTGTPGVFKNRAGVLVDGDGVMLNISEVKQKDEDRFARALGKKVKTPAELLKAVALDPQLPLATRMDAAKAAAPYFDRKKPQAIDGGEDGAPIRVLDVSKLKGMSVDELLALRALMEKVKPGENDDEQEDEDA